MEIFNFEQGTPEWNAMRRGVITGTRMKAVLGSATVRKGLVLELLGEEFSDVDESEESAKSYRMEYGSVAESVLRDEILEGIEQVGFIKATKTLVDSEGKEYKVMDWLGVSPDGVITVDGKITKAIEIKSPGEKNWAKWILEGGIPEEHLPQVLQYFIVIDTLQSLDFIIFAPNAKKKAHRQITITVTRDQLFEKIVEAKKAIASFKTEWEAKRLEIIQRLGD